jgi:adenylate cyclase class 2
LHEETAVEETYEVEVKFPLSDKDAIRKAIIDAGGIKLNTQYQSDKYYDHPCRSFSETDEAVRIRHMKHIEGTTTEGLASTSGELTYKGPKVDKKSKTRVEYNVNLKGEDLEPMSQILLNIGFKHIANVIKEREFYEIEGITASLDDVADVGSFIEFELIAEGKHGMQAARDRILDLVRSMVLDEKDMIRDSYLEMYLRKVS